MRICSHRPPLTNRCVTFHLSLPLYVAMLAAAGPLLVMGCMRPPPPYVPAYAGKRVQAHCFDGVPHIRGSKPWIAGGRCCCTPSADLMEQYHRDGFGLEMDVADLIEQYHVKGIILATDPDATDPAKCGDHVVRGGNSLVPPTPCTREYEEVITDTVYVIPVSDTKR